MEAWPGPTLEGPAVCKLGRRPAVWKRGRCLSIEDSISAGRGPSFEGPARAHFMKTRLGLAVVSWNPVYQKCGDCWNHVAISEDVDILISNMQRNGLLIFYAYCINIFVIILQYCINIFNIFKISWNSKYFLPFDRLPFDTQTVR